MTKSAADILSPRDRRAFAASKRTPATDYRFDELPLYVEPGWEAGMISGVADIAFDSAGLWFITDISVDASNGKSGDALNAKCIQLDRDHPLYAMIERALESTRGEAIEAKVEKLMEEQS